MQLVFIPGAGAGASADAYVHQTSRFPGSLAVTLPGHPTGTLCADVRGYADWLRGWLWAHDARRDLVLVGYTLGASIALEYALDYPDEVAGIVLMTAAMRPKLHRTASYELHLKALDSEDDFERWLDARRRSMAFVEPGLRERLLDHHRRNGPMVQLADTKAIDAFDVRDRIAQLRPRLLLIRGAADPTAPPAYEAEIHGAVPGSRLIELTGAGHFPMLEQPDEVNALVAAFTSELESAVRG
ncbi:MAG: alpha/beta hydrolase [Microbacterium sp.]|uniref:alpha/beta fold hydrolase n=1 Tax=Microbacterium sp. TaxID=51671 RepID=UPI0039E4406D